MHTKPGISIEHTSYHLTLTCYHKPVDLEFKHTNTTASMRLNMLKQQYFSGTYLRYYTFDIMYDKKKIYAMGTGMQ